MARMERLANRLLPVDQRTFNTGIPVLIPAVSWPMVCSAVTTLRPPHGQDSLTPPCRSTATHLSDSRKLDRSNLIGQVRVRVSGCRPAAFPARSSHDWNGIWRGRAANSWDRRELEEPGTPPASTNQVATVVYGTGGGFCSALAGPYAVENGRSGLPKVSGGPGDFLIEPRWPVWEGGRGRRAAGGRCRAWFDHEENCLARVRAANRPGRRALKKPETDQICPRPRRTGGEVATADQGHQQHPQHPMGTAWGSTAWNTTKPNDVTRIEPGGRSAAGRLVIARK